jgi:hypothetical protein
VNIHRPLSLIKRPDETIVIVERDANGNPSKHIAEMSWGASEGGMQDALMFTQARELLAIVGIFIGHDERFCVAVGGNPTAVDAMLERARKAYAEAGGE